MCYVPRSLFLKEFEYHSPRTIDGAASLLSRYKGDAKIMAGGHSLIPLMRLGLADPPRIIDINKVRGLSYIRRTKDSLRIGAMTRIFELESSEVIRRSCPLLSETARMIADPQVRNRGTIGGNIAHGDPANDLPPTMLALGSTFELVGKKRRRSVRAENFFKDLFVTNIAHNEILAEVRCPVLGARNGGAFLKFERRVGDFATVSVASFLALDERGYCEKVGIGLGAVGDTAIKARKAEESLVGKQIRGEEMIEEVAEQAASECNPRSDVRGSREFKLELVRVLTKKAILKAHHDAIQRERAV